MMLPTLHQNGTSKEELSRQLSDVLVALEVALGKLVEAGPNQRDYPQGEQAMWQALIEHNARAIKIGEVAAELQTLLDYVADAEPGGTQ
jgi:hypothetical protein